MLYNYCGIEKLFNRVYCIIIINFNFVGISIIVYVGCIVFCVNGDWGVIFKVKSIFNICFIEYNMINCY